MDLITTFVRLNRDLIFFGYGLVFFVLGLAIALQSRNSSRLDLARSLQWLAAFGFAHGFHEWGDLFIPIQATYLSPATVEVLHNLHLLLLALSFIFLFEFGVTLLRPLGQARWSSGVSGGLLATWILVSFFILPRLFPDSATWHNLANALARYFIGLPGGLIAAYGLRHHTMQRIAPLQVPHIVRMLRVAGVLLAVYAIFGGLIPPPIPFFPGNWINSAAFEETLLAPPAVFRSVIGLGLAIAIIRALEVFEVETARIIESMEQQQILAAERNRLARELHDGAIQKVYTAGLLVESAQNLSRETGGPLASRLERAVSVLNDAIADLRRNLGELHSTPGDKPFPLALQELAQDPRFRSLLDIQLDFELPRQEELAPARADHVLAVVNEALSNAARHARATQVHILGGYQEGRLRMTIRDNGTGIPSEFQSGFGLRNMRDRARLLGGELEVQAANGKGTQIVLDIPWKDER